MSRALVGSAHHLLLTAIVVLGIAFLPMAAAPQDKAFPQTAGVEDTRMGPYRALAQLSFEALKKGDNATAATLARVLERTWDKGEQDLANSSPEVWRQIDEAMDGFVKPIIHYSAKTPDPAKVQASYDEYLTKLKQVELIQQNKVVGTPQR